MESLNEKIVRLLQEKFDAFLGTEGQKSRDDFKLGLSWAIETIESLTRQAKFEEVAKELIKHLTKNYHPRHTAIVTDTNAQLFEGVKSTGIINDYIPD